MDKDKAKAEFQERYKRLESILSKTLEAIDTGHKMLDELNDCIAGSPSKVFIVTEIRQYEKPQHDVVERPPSVFTTRENANDYIKFCARQQALTFEDGNENWFRYSKNRKYEILFEIHPTLLNLGMKIFQFLN